MIALYRIGDRPAEPIDLGSEGWRAPDWNRFLLAAGRADCAVIICGEAESEACIAHLREFRAEHPSVPLVLYLEADALALREVADLVIHEVVFFDDGTAGLRRAIGRASRRWLHHLPDLVRTVEGIDVRLKRVLRLCFAAPEPYLYVEDLARAASLSLSTLERYWRAHWEGSPPFRLQELLAWVLVLRGYQAKQPANTWKAVAGRLGTSPRRLRAVGKRLGLGTLIELEAMPADELLARFDREVCRKLLGVSLATRLNRSA